MADRLLVLLVRLVVVAGILFLLLPLVAVVGASFNRPPALGFPPETLSLDPYRQIPTRVFDSFFVSIRLAVVASLIAITMALPAAFALGRSALPGRTGLETVLRSPLQVPQIVIGVAAFQFYVFLGGAFGLPLRSRFAGLVIAHVLLVLPYMVGTLVARVESLDPRLEEAAASLGAGRLRTLGRVVLPLVRPAVVAAVTLSFIISFDNVPISIFLTSPGQTTLPVALFTAAELSLSPWIYAAATWTIVFSVVFTWLLERIVGLRSVLSL